MLGLDPETPLSVLSRFGITTLDQQVDDDLSTVTVVASMPVAGMRNPFNDQPSVAALAILVDDVAGRVNYYRRARGQWTVSSELTVELAPEAVDLLWEAPEEPVVASARPLGPAGAPMLAVCTLTHRGAVIGGGTVHTMPIDGGPQSPPAPRVDRLVRNAETTLAQLMSVSPAEAGDDGYRLTQLPDPIVNNLIGIVHGGVSSAGLEIVASAAINHQQSEPLRTASIRVNFLRPFFSGAQSIYAGTAQSIYAGTALRIGRTSAVADARALGPDGKAAVIARVTGYR